MKRYRMAVVGLHFGKWLIDNEIIKGYAAPYFELAAVCDQNEVLAHACAREYHVKAYTRLEDALADRDIDLVTLITGPNHRAKLLDKIVDAGKAVMTTKPFETDAAEALRLSLIHICLSNCCRSSALRLRKFLTPCGSARRTACWIRNRSSAP